MSPPVNAVPNDAKLPQKADAVVIGGGISLGLSAGPLGPV
jgi:hypothetical protein